MAKTIINTLKISLALLLVVLPSIPCRGDIAGIGVAPSEIFVANALRGGEFQKAIKIFNVLENATVFAINATGDVAKWVSFYTDENLITPVTNVTVAPKSDQTVFVVFTIPNEASNGNHSGNIDVQTLPGEVADSTGTSVTLSAPVRVIIEVVGTQILTGEVRSISTIDTEVGYLLRIKVDFQNTGNVVAKPKVETFILKDGILKDSFTYSKTSVRPGLKDIISVEWNTTGREPGDYTANVTVSLDGNILAEKNLSFKILPLGTLTRKGELVALSYEGKPLVGIVLRIHATFRNTGLIDTDAKFVGEVYKNGDMIDVIESIVTRVEVGTQKNLTAYFKLTEEGQHNIKGYVAYDGKKTDTKEMLIEVQTSKNPAADQPLNIQMIGSIAAITTIPALVYFIKKRRDNSSNKVHAGRRKK